MPSKISEKKPEKEVAAEFTSYYLQRATQEFAEDLDKVRSADDFKSGPDGIAMLVHALQQGTALFSSEDQRRIIVAAQTTSPAAEEK
ncbi:putative ribosome assembly protein 3 protein [Diplogelasinospora grovesii]|uniref:Ribosome assembly protein 3 n=1 Tax=Diplogelasinospora grovesii TaxID=303347 RepID=A0AAN6S201_9PEZI|nr:putative ribosome assembly protein 3 protein [Diplogelasinospora grovesii]